MLQIGSITLITRKKILINISFHGNNIIWLRCTNCNLILKSPLLTVPIQTWILLSHSSVNKTKINCYLFIHQIMNENCLHNFIFVFNIFPIQFNISVLWCIFELFTEEAILHNCYLCSCIYQCNRDIHILNFLCVCVLFFFFLFLFSNLNFWCGWLFEIAMRFMYAATVTP